MRPALLLDFFETLSCSTRPAPGAGFLQWRPMPGAKQDRSKGPCVAQARGWFGYVWDTFRTFKAGASPIKLRGIQIPKLALARAHQKYAGVVVGCSLAHVIEHSLWGLHSVLMPVQELRVQLVLNGKLGHHSLAGERPIAFNVRGSRLHVYHQTLQPLHDDGMLASISTFFGSGSHSPTKAARKADTKM